MTDKTIKKNKLAFPAGVITFILALVGLGFVISLAVNGIKSITDDEEKKKEYENFLKPVVMFDPNTFDDLTGADTSQLVYSAVWALLLNENGADNYPYAEGETVGIIVPQADIEKYFISLYGTEIDLASMHSKIDMSEYGITYDAASKSYILPITGVESAYVPKVYSIGKSGTSVILSVGYIGNKAFADINSDEYSAPEPDKMMKITLRERDGGLFVSSIQTDGKSEMASVVLAKREQEYVTDDNVTQTTQMTTELVTEDASEEINTDESVMENVSENNGNDVSLTNFN